MVRAPVGSGQRFGRVLGGWARILLMKMLVGVALIVGVRVLHGGGDLRQHGGQYARGHGGADQSPKDQHHHQNQSKAATHA
ncbi:hypothetical protein [Acidovorax sp. M2(2025)]|uniref:hypothetical protein n=1 Tax=Acidovorax sp. M2(2025) TaxID=3411355 RepID=UPI003BF5CDAC